MKAFTAQEIQSIREQYRVEKGCAVNVIELARQHGVSQETIRRIAKGTAHNKVK